MRRLLLGAVLFTSGAGGAAEAPFPVDLPTVMRLANAQNLDVRLAETAVAEARAGYSSALERFIPSLTLGFAGTRHEGNTQAADGAILDVDKRSNASGVTVAAQVSPGEAWFGVLQSRQLVQAADEALGVQRQDAVLAAIQEYFELVRARAQVAVVREALAASASYEQQLGEAVRIGIAFKGDELRVRTQTQRLQIEEQQAMEQERLAAARLVRTLHLDPAVQLQAADAAPLPLQLPEAGTPLAAQLQQAVRDRAELKRSQAQVAAAEQGKRAVTLGPLAPTLNISAFGGSLGGGRQGAASTAAGSSRDYYLGFNWRFGPGGLFDLGRIRGSDAKLAAANLGDLKLRDDIARQVVEARARVDSTRQQVQLAEGALASATETWRLTRDRKSLGVGTVLEDIQAQQELARARTTWVTAVTDHNKAQYALRRAVGAPF